MGIDFLIWDLLFAVLKFRVNKILSVCYYNKSIHILMILIKHLSSIMFLSRQSLNLIPYVDEYQYIDCTSQDILLDTCNQVIA